MLPKLYQEKMKKFFKDDYPQYIKCFNEKSNYGLRVNTNKISVADFLKVAPWKLVAIPWVDNGLYYDGAKIQPAKHPFYHGGLYYLQEPSAMAPAGLLSIKPGDKVLDLCAAPGGKATELGARLGGGGLLVANDISISRAKGLLKNIELMGIGNALVVSEEPKKLVKHFGEYFDKILIDAPCSGEGMFRRDPGIIKAWEEKSSEYYSNLQKDIIIQGAKMLKPGGLLMYSTCTFDPRENEQVIEFLLSSCPDFRIVEVDKVEKFAQGLPKYSESKDLNLKKTIRIYPHKVKGEGHYIALLEKMNQGLSSERISLEKDREFIENDYEKIENHKSVSKQRNMNDLHIGNVKELPEELSVFWTLVNRRVDIKQIFIIGEQVYYLPKGTPPLAGLRFLRTGLYLGELKKKRFEPSQALAMNLRKDEFKLTIDFVKEDNRVIKYLKGETLDVTDITNRDDKGWALICVTGYPLGFGKLANGIVKNKYQAGWRMM